MKSSSRRAFLKRSATAVAAPLIVPSTFFGKEAPSNRITMGFIGDAGASEMLSRPYREPWDFEWAKQLAAIPS